MIRSHTPPANVTRSTLACGLLMAAVHFACGSTAVDQIPHLQSLPDATDSLQRQIIEHDGNLVLGGAKVFRITRPLEFDLARHGAVAVRAENGVTLVMDGPGPALRFKGSHEGTASPRTFKAATWNERMPIVSGIEILGNHAEADGMEFDQTVGPVISGVSVRWCRHGIRFTRRNRNVLISDSHLYENAGIGVYLDDVNLHQINIANSHISYNRGGGIVVRDGNVRNLQVAGCDIEANMPGDTTPTRTANILIDVTGYPESRDKSVAEIAITGCTIQHSANYSGSETATLAPGGANIRLAGKAIYPIDSVTITGNVLSDTTTNIDIDHAVDVAVSANNFFAPKPANLTVKNSRRVVVTGNTFNPRQFVRPGTISFTDCTDGVVATSSIHDFATPDGALVLTRCAGFTLNALNFSDCGSGMILRDCMDTSVTACRVSRTAANRPDLLVDDLCAGILLDGNAFSGTVSIAPGTLLINPSTTEK